MKDTKLDFLKEPQLEKAEMLDLPKEIYSAIEGRLSRYAFGLDETKGLSRLLQDAREKPFVRSRPTDTALSKEYRRWGRCG
jgi:hypothetical protein